MCNGGSKPICNGTAVPVAATSTSVYEEVDDVFEQPEPEVVTQAAAVAAATEDTSARPPSIASLPEAPASPVSIVVTTPEGVDWEPRWGELGQHIAEDFIGKTDNSLVTF